MMKPRTLESQITGSLWGAVIGDALGTPVEGQSREALLAEPVTGMRAHGTHDQPAGTWSDDTSMLLCTVESLLSSNSLNTRDMAGRFRRWLLEGHWTPFGQAFGFGIATRQSLARFCAGKPPERCGGREEFENGNGSLMRILPAALWFVSAHTTTALEAIHRVSSLTHAHPRSQLSCGYFSLVIRALAAGKSKEVSVAEAWQQALSYYPHQEEFVDEWPLFKRLEPDCIATLPEEEIRSGGYCIHTLEAAIWCLLKAETFEGCLLKAVNLGEDSDTTACVSGALAGLQYGMEGIPPAWHDVITRHDEIDHLFRTFVTRLRI